ncbi:MAG: GlsB/YeaQ/YmgE family stress response membrane protein [Polyangiaceae bacterium]
MLSFILFLLFGLVVGAVARFLVPGREPGGWVTSILVGIAGSFIGGYIGRVLSIYRAGEPAGFLMSLLGAVLLLIGYHALVRSRATA